MQLPAPLQLTARLDRAFVARFEELPAATRTALLVAALDDGSDVGEILEAASIARGRPVAVADLTPAVDAGLADVDQTHMTFRHPIVRSGIRQAASRRWVIANE